MLNRSLATTDITAQDEIELKTIQNNGLEQRQVQLALKTLFQSHQEVHIPSISALSGTAILPLAALKQLGKKYIAFSFDVNQKHQVAVWIRLQPTLHVSVIDSLDPQDPHSYQQNKEAHQRLRQLIDIENVSVQLGTSHYTTQTDDWSCGLRVTAEIAHLFQQTLRPPNYIYIEEQEDPNLQTLLLDCYHAYKQAETREQTEQKQIYQNEQHKRQLLELIENYRKEKNYYQTTHTNVNDIFKPLADSLQLNLWGNLDRKDDISHQKGRINQSSEYQRSLSLEQLESEYEAKHDLIGNSILKLSVIFVEEQKKTLPTFMIALHQLGNNKEFKPSTDTTHCLHYLLSDFSVSDKIIIEKMIALLAQKSTSLKSKLDNLLQLIGFSAEDKAWALNNIAAHYPNADIDYVINHLILIAIDQTYHQQSYTQADKSRLSLEQKAMQAALQNKLNEIKEILTAAFPDTYATPLFEKLEKEKILLQLANNVLAFSFLKKFVNSHYFTSCSESEIFIAIKKIATISENTNIYHAVVMCPASKDHYEKIFNEYFNIKSVSGNDIKLRRELLNTAIQHNNQEIIRICLDTTEALRTLLLTKDIEDTPLPLHCAAQYGTEETVSHLLIVSGADYSITNNFKESALHIASEHGNAAAVATLVKMFKDIPIDTFGQTPLHLAAENGDAKCIELLLVHKPDSARDLDNNQQTPLHTAAKHGNRKAILLLIEAGAFVDDTNYQKNTPLHFAAANGHADCIDVLLKNHAACIAPNEEGKHPLHLAARCGDARSVTLLVKAGADIHAQSNSNCIPLEYAAMYSNADCIQALLNAPTPHRKIDCENALFLAAEHAGPDVIQQLLKTNASINKRIGNVQRTPLHNAIIHKNIPAIKLLLENNADILIQDKDRHDAMYHAIQTKDTNVLNALIAHRDVNMRGECGRTLLHIAARSDQVNLAQALLRANADLTIKDDNDWTPLTDALTNCSLKINNTAVAQLILDSYDHHIYITFKELHIVLELKNQKKLAAFFNRLLCRCNVTIDHITPLTDAKKQDLAKKFVEFLQTLPYEQGRKHAEAVLKKKNVLGKYLVSNEYSKSFWKNDITTSISDYLKNPPKPAVENPESPRVSR